MAEFDFQGHKVSQGKVRTLNGWGGRLNHSSVTYLVIFYWKLPELDNYCSKCCWWLGGILFWGHNSIKHIAYLRHVTCH